MTQATAINNNSCYIPDNTAWNVPSSGATLSPIHGEILDGPTSQSFSGSPTAQQPGSQDGSDMLQQFLHSDLGQQLIATVAPMLGLATGVQATPATTGTTWTSAAAPASNLAPGPTPASTSQPAVTARLNIGSTNNSGSTRTNNSTTADASSSVKDIANNFYAMAGKTAAAKKAKANASDGANAAADEKPAVDKQPPSHVMGKDARDNFQADWEYADDKGRTLQTAGHDDDPKFKDVKGTTYSNTTPGVVVIKNTAYFDSKDPAQHAQYEKAAKVCKQWDMVNKSSTWGLDQRQMHSLGLDGTPERGKGYTLYDKNASYGESPVNTVVKQSAAMADAGVIAFAYKSGKLHDTYIVSNDNNPELYAQLQQELSNH